MRWLRRLSLRARLMLLGVVGLAAGLALGGVVLVTALDFALLRGADDEARTTATAVAKLVDEGQVPAPLPVAGDRLRVQVVDAGNRVLASSIDADRLVPMLDPAERDRAVAGAVVPLPGSRIGVPGPVRVVATQAGPAGNRRTVLVAKATGDLARSAVLLRTVLVVAFPLLVLLLAAVAWRVVGATLRPVEALRRGAEEITGGVRPGQLPLPASEDEIHRLAVTLNGMLDRLDAARARQRAFVADAAHELRSPLTNMRTELEVAQRLADRTDWPALADDLLADVQRLSRLVDDLLLLARSDAAAERGDAAGRRSRRADEPVELGALLAAAAQRCPSPPVEVTPPTGEHWTVGDPDALSRVVGNLLDNAVRHAAGRVVLAVADAGPYHLVTVTDDGPGIPAADRERVFGRFTRLDDARARDAGGSGLGLAIVAELVRRHAGTVTLTDAGRAPTGARPAGAGGQRPGAGPGLRAEVRLPAHRPERSAQP